jgi:enoyl-CoA hydratase/carnithine racemase
VIELQKHENVFVLHMKSGENRFNQKFLDELNGLLDEVERSTEAAALVTTGEGKFYSNGLDLEWMASVGAGQFQKSIKDVHELLGRMLAFPLITVAALNGHVFAAGAMLALAHDFRVMRNDRGFFCLPEADIQIPFTRPMSALIQARLPVPTAHEAMVTGKRYTAEQAERRQIVDAIASDADVLPQAIALAKTHAGAGKHRPTLSTIKRTAYSQVFDAIAAEVAR